MFKCGLRAYSFWLLQGLDTSQLACPFTYPRPSWLFPFLWLWIKLWEFSCRHTFSNHVHKYLGWQLMGCVLSLFSFVRNSQTNFQSDSTIFHSLKNEDSCCSASLSALVTTSFFFCLFLILAISNQFIVVFIVLSCIFLLTLCWVIFICLLYIFFGEVSLQIVCSFLSWECLFCCCCCLFVCLFVFLLIVRF